MMPNVLQVLTNAIKEKHCVAIRYHGQKHVRVVEPHAIYSSENDEMVLDAFQVRGYSSSGRPTPFWRPFRLKKINAVSLLKESFTPRMEEGFSASKTKYKKGLIALVDDRRKTFAVPLQAMVQANSQANSQEVMGPHLPTKNPFRR